MATVRAAALSTDLDSPMLLISTPLAGRQRRAAQPRPSSLLAVLFAVTCLLGAALPAAASAAFSVPDRIGFSSTKVGTTATKTVTLSNDSAYSVALVVIGPGPLFVRGGDWETTDLAPGEHRNVTMSYTPVKQGSDLEDVVLIPIYYGADGAGFAGDDISVEVTGSAYEENPTRVEPKTIDFGDVVVGSTATSDLETTLEDSTHNVRVDRPTAEAPFGFSGAAADLLGPNHGDQTRSSFSASFTPTARGPFTASATLTVTDEATLTSFDTTITLKGNGVSPPDVNIDPASLDIGNVTVGDSTSVDVTVSNNGDLPLEILSFNTGGSSTWAATGTNADIAPGGSRTFSLRFTPAAPGTSTATFSVGTNDPDTPEVTTELTGTGVAPPVPTLSVSQPNVNWGFQRPGPHPCPVIVKNTGNATVFFDAVYVGAGDVPPNTRVAALAAGSAFSWEGSTAPLEPGDSRTFQVIFDPSEPIAYADTFHISSNAENSPIDIPLTGKGQVGKLTATPGSLAFGDVGSGAKVSKTVTIKNTGTFASSLTTSVTGAGASKFAVSGSTSSLAINGTRTFTVTFAPTARGAQAASLVIGGNAFNTPLTVPLSGRGVGPVATLSSSSLAFGAVKLNTASAKTITVKNTGETSLTFSSAPKITGTDAARFTVSGATTSLAAGAARTFTVTFKPTAKKANVASLAFATNSVPAPAAVALSGTGS